MHKRTIEFFRLLSPVLLTLLLLVPSHASAAGLAARLAGPEQPDAPFEPTDIPSTNEIPDFGYVYTVVAGDDVWLIAIAHGISMETLVAANHLESPYWIYPGTGCGCPLTLRLSNTPNQNQRSQRKQRRRSMLQRQPPLRRRSPWRPPWL